MRVMKHLIVVLMFFCLASCAGVPENIKPVSNFDLDKYMGEWYEIVRLDHSFERGLEQVKATYSLNENGFVKVVNKGYSVKKQKWKEAVGKAKLVEGASTGFLKVSFFGPFYGPYVIYELDEPNYQYAFVSSSKGYLWLLSRTPSVSEEVMDKFIESAEMLGYMKEDLILVRQK